jgi:hypothetical protein
MKIITGVEAKALGLIKYFTGKPCYRKHVAERYVRDWKCVECRKEDHQAEYAKNKTHIKAMVSAWQKNNPEQYKQKLDAWVAAHPERVKEIHKQSRMRRVASIRERGQQWKDANPDKRAASVAQRRAAKLNRTPQWLSNTQRKQIVQHYTEAKQLSKLLGEWYVVDHIIPLQGKNVSGLHVPWNLQVIPRIDNLVKSNKFLGA